jgi:predicted ATPase
MSNTNPKVIQEMEKDLYRLTKEFQSIRLLKVTGESKRTTVLKKLGLADKDDNTFWSDQLSEGVLYFLALLAIIHQPNPPHLLMLEEPEKGIHPRRIKEIIELIFQIAKDKGIRVILTTHSTYVVDQFTEIPEGVHIVDKIDKSTQVKNLKRDFIDKEEGREDKIDYLSSLGEHWSIGFLGGVPE